MMEINQLNEGQKVCLGWRLTAVNRKFNEQYTIFEISLGAHGFSNRTR